MINSDFTPRRDAFRKLHESGCFVIPNPWDAGSARYLQHLGFQALATTSAGFAFSCGLPDGAVPRDRMLGNIGEIVGATDVPVNADFESGYADDPEGVAANVRLCIETGVAGFSIEDSTGDRIKPLYELTLAIERIKAARAAIDAGNSGVLLTARAECYLVGHPEPFKESMRRLQAYSEAGADVLYAPGVSQRDEIKAIVTHMEPKPVNIIVSKDFGLNVAALADLGCGVSVSDLHLPAPPGLVSCGLPRRLPRKAPSTLLTASLLLRRSISFSAGIVDLRPRCSSISRTWDTIAAR
jgi:2-methylisocitrate lyase-like PEP mutase family enzyme